MQRQKTARIMKMNKKVIAATGNKGKLLEISEILTPIGFEAISQKDAGIDIETEETGTTFRENAYLKAKAVYDIAHTAVIADDSGLSVDHLNGAPGVYSHRYAGENATDVDRCEKLLHDMENAEDRGAEFVCVICYIDENGNASYCEGKCRGKIGYEPLGANGFGYDPVFMYGERSFAQLSAEEKNSVSHRAKALEKFREMLTDKGEIYADK